MNFHLPQTLFLVGLVAYLVIRVVYQRRVAGADVTVKRSSKIDKLLVWLVIFGQIVIPMIYMFTSLLNVANYQLVQMATLLGPLFWVAGLWVFWRSHADLGKNWSVSLELQSDHRLVTHGVYRMVRHPMYSSFLLFGLGQAMLLPNWLAGFSSLVAVALLCFVRVPHEEAMMCEHFGQDYQDYMKRTGSVVPKVMSKD